MTKTGWNATGYSAPTTHSDGSAWDLSPIAPRPARDLRPRCDICGEAIRPNGEMAEMYDPIAGGHSVICHADCGLALGFEVA